MYIEELISNVTVKIALLKLLYIYTVVHEGQKKYMTCI